MKQETTLTDNLGQPYQYAEVDDNGEICYRRADGDWDVPVELPVETIAALALQAHEKNITLNEHIVNILLEEIAKVTAAHGESHELSKSI